MRTFLLAATLTLGAVPALAQSPEGRITIGVNAGYQAATNNFSDRFTFEVYREQGNTQSQYPIKGDFLVDVGGSVRVWKGLGAGVAVSRYTRNPAAHTVSSVPNPLYLEKPREVTGDTSATRTETGAHVQVLYLFPALGHLHLAGFAGPSYISVQQDLVTAVRYQDTYPFDEAGFTGATTQRLKRSATGFNAGADAAWMFNKTFGVGGVIRFARATVKLHAPGSRTVSVDAGGAQAGAGLRVRF